MRVLKVQIYLYSNLFLTPASRDSPKVVAGSVTRGCEGHCDG